MQAPLVYVLVINWNGREHLAECFGSLLKSSYPNAHFLLIDNASEDGSVEFVRARYGEDPRVEILRLPTNLGWGGGNNEGMARAIDGRADYIFLLNNDTATAPDAIEKLVEMAERQPTIGALAPKMVLYHDPWLLNSVGLACSIIGCGWDLGLGRLDGPKWNDPRPVIGVCGGAAFFRTAVLRKTGPLLADFGIYLDDLDLCLRVWGAGYEVRTCPEAVVRHKFSATMNLGEGHRRKYYLTTLNRLKLVLCGFPASRLPGTALWTVVAECRALGRAVLDGEPWRVGAHGRAWAAALAYVPKAIAVRRTRRAQGLDNARFWDLVCRDSLFFRGTEFPRDGWYGPRRIAGEDYQPISARASLRVPGGRLRLRHTNCYPRLGPTDIEVLWEGKGVATLGTVERAEIVLDVQEGTLEFRAKRIFNADDTHECADFGGWIGVDYGK